MSAKAYQALPRDVQNIMMETALECAAYERNLLRDSEASQIGVLKSKGMQVNTPAKEPFRKAAAPVYREFGAQFGKGLVDKIIGTK